MGWYAIIQRNVKPCLILINKNNYNKLNKILIYSYIYKTLNGLIMKKQVLLVGWGL